MSSLNYDCSITLARINFLGVRRNLRDLHILEFKDIRQQRYKAQVVGIKKAGP